MNTVYAKWFVSRTRQERHYTHANVPCNVTRDENVFYEETHSDIITS